MGFRGKMNDGINIIILDCFFYQGRIADIAMHKEITTIPMGGCHIVQTLCVAGIGQFIEIDNFTGKLWLAENQPNKIGANKARSAGDHNIS